MHSVLPQIDVDSSEFWPATNKSATIPVSIHSTMDFKGLSIRQLLDYCLATDNEAAWNEVFERIIPTAFGVVHKKVNRWGKRDPALIQDLFQETMLKLADKDKAALRAFEWFHEDSIYAYVKVVASRVVADHFRKGDREVFLEDIPNTFSSTAFSEQEILQNLQWDEIEQCLRSIEAVPEEKAIFRLYYRAGFTAKEIGALPCINLSEKEVETVLARLKRQVRRGLMGGKLGGSAASE